MYERFTDRARKILFLANQEAKRFNHDYIGTEHILLGMLNEGTAISCGIACHVLRDMGLNIEKCRAEINALIQAGSCTVVIDKLPQTPNSKKVIEFAIEEARNLDHHYLGTEHLLLGLLRVREGSAYRVLTNLGISADLVRKEILFLLKCDLREEYNLSELKKVEPENSNRQSKMLLARVKELIDTIKDNDEFVAQIKKLLGY